MTALIDASWGLHFPWKADGGGAGSAATQWPATGSAAHPVSLLPDPHGLWPEDRLAHALARLGAAVQAGEAP